MEDPLGKYKDNVTPSSTRTESMDASFLEAIREDIHPEDMLKQYRNIHTDDVRAHAWSDVAAKAQTYGDQMVNRWSREIKTYLIFAGLFSAILTPFNVESYKMLQPGGRDSTGQTLERISLQLHSFSISYPFVNSTQPGSPFVRDAGNGSQTVAQSAIWLNSLWFSALILSLTSALVSIIASQWLSEYRAVCGTSHDIARLRQYRAENLEDWHVGEIVLIIPVLLVLSLGLFFSGLLVLLWTLHPSVAIVASVLIAIAVAFTLVVAVLPVFSVSCAYLSPQARIMYAFWQHLLSPIVTFFRYFIFLYLISVIYDTISSTDSWLSDYLLRLLTDEGRNKLKALSWAQREESEIHVARYKLDVNVLTKAWESTLDQEAVSFATICLPDLPSKEVLSYFTNLHDSITKHSDGDVVTTRHGTMSTYCPTNALLVFYVFLCTINLHTVSMQTNLCSRVVRSISAPQHHIWRDTESENGERAEWLLSAVTWLQPRVEKFVKPILESGSADELDEKQAEAVMTSAVEIISNHCRQLGESLSKPEVKQNLPSKQYRSSSSQTCEQLGCIPESVQPSYVKKHEPTPSAEDVYDLLYRQSFRLYRFLSQRQDDAKYPRNSAHTTVDHFAKHHSAYLRVTTELLRKLAPLIHDPRCCATDDLAGKVLSQLTTVLGCYEEVFKGVLLENIVLSRIHSEYLALFVEIIRILQVHPILAQYVPSDILSTMLGAITFLKNLTSGSRGFIGDAGADIKEGYPEALVEVYNAGESLRSLSTEWQQKRRARAEHDSIQYVSFDTTSQHDDTHLTAIVAYYSNAIRDQMMRLTNLMTDNSPRRTNTAPEELPTGDRGVTEEDGAPQPSNLKDAVGPQPGGGSADSSTGADAAGSAVNPPEGDAADDPRPWAAPLPSLGQTDGGTAHAPHV